MNDELREQVRSRYAAAATAVDRGTATGCCGPGGCGREVGETAPEVLSAEALETNGDAFGAALYDAEDRTLLPDAALLASLGCGNPTAVAELHAGETVLDLGSGGGIDVLLSARRVGPTGRAIGLDMTDEMLDLARFNASEAGVDNVEFVKGTIEDVPLPDASVDVIISNCVINLSIDKPAVMAEMFRVLKPGGRVGVSDVVAEDRLSPAERAERGDFAGCIAGALSETEYRDGLVAAGFGDVEVVFTHEAADGLHAAIVRAVKPA